jgi:predicted cobalt transporter CbtA
MRTALLGLFGGATVAGLLFVLGVLLFPASLPTKIFFAPAGLFLPMVGRLVPSRVIYALVPDGGAPAGALLVVASSLVFWLLLGVCVAFMGRRLASSGLAV